MKTRKNTKSPLFFVEEFAGRKWYGVGSFETVGAAFDHAGRYAKSRVLHKGKLVKPEVAKAAQAMAAAEIADDDNDTVALAEAETPAPKRRPRKGKASKAASGEAVLLDPADLNARLSTYLYEADPKRMDVDRLERWAKANDLWQPAYDALDGGRKRMCCGIRARKKLAAGLPLVFPA